MKTATLEIKVYCDKCRDEVSAEFDRDGTLMVDPCEGCLREAKEAADEAAYDRGFAEGESSAS